MNDYTVIIYWDGEKCHIEKVFYRDFEKFENLPSICKSSETKIEFEEYWNSNGRNPL